MLNVGCFSLTHKYQTRIETFDKFDRIGFWEASVAQRYNDKINK
jgi:hypothetical protein